MMAYFYTICLLVSVVVLGVMACRNYNNIDITYWSMVVIIPIILLGYMLKAKADVVSDAKIAFCIIYLDSTVLPMLMLFSMLKSLGVTVKAWINGTAYCISFLHLLSIWMCMDGTLYYKTLTIEKTNLGTITKMTDGPLKMTHYIYLLIMFCVVVGVLVGCFLYKRDCSIKSLLVYATFSLIAIIYYLAEMILGLDFSLLPILYVIGDVVVAFRYETYHSHDMDCVVVDQKEHGSLRGYVAFDNNKNLLCYNENALEFVPELKGKRIDAQFTDKDKKLKDIFYSLIEESKVSNNNTKDIERNGLNIRCTVTDFYMRKDGKPAGYLCELQDVTVEQGYMNLIKEYGQSLEKDVHDKTEHIQYIQQRIVLSMATIIENRDMNTGGHVKRTSDIIKIIVDEMRKENIGDLDDTYADEIIRSAPMHDLGKISIDNAILNKPGKLTDDEYKVMKTHSAKSGEIVRAILEGVEEPHFVQTAYQLARFHHERWDGRGYPERLMQEEIPLEARIMAVADVYDALVSKRCYKEPMSFEQAATIMIEGMGTQFDPMMKPIFENCREKLEEYYSDQKE